MQGALLRNVIIHNLVVHLDIAWQGLRTGKYKDRDDAMAYIEASSSFWNDMNWQHSEDYTPTPDYHRMVVQFQQIAQVYPYAVSIDPHVKQREPRIMRAHLRSPPEDDRPLWMIQLEEGIAKVEAGPKHEHCIRPITEEEADFMDNFLDYDAEHASEKSDAEMVHTPGHPFVMMDLDTDLGLRMI